MNSGSRSRRTTRCLFTRSPSPRPIAARNSSGVTHVREHEPARASPDDHSILDDPEGERATAVSPRGSAGEDQEHVLERPAARSIGIRLHAARPQRALEIASPSSGRRGDRRATRTGAERSTRQHLRRGLGRRSKRSSTTSRVECSAISFARRALGDDVSAVHDHQPVAELLGFVHVVRREHEGHALASAGTTVPRRGGALAGRGRSWARRAAGARAG